MGHLSFSFPPRRSASQASSESPRPTWRRADSGKSLGARVPALGSGRQLEQPVRGRMERWFGTDFTRVRVHTDSEAQRSAEAMGAAAYTIGRDVFFGPGRYSPESSAGAHLVAHELTHVLQQRAAAPVDAPPLVFPLDRTEAEACRAAPESRLSRQAIQMAPAAGASAAPPAASPEAAAQEIESLLEQVILSDDDQQRIVELLENVANARGAGVTPANTLGRVFSRLRSDRPSRLRMAIHAPIAALMHADPTYYDLLFDRIDDYYLAMLTGFRDQTTYRGMGSARQMAGMEKARKEEQEEEETARFEGWEPGPLLQTRLPRNSQNVYLAKQVIQRLASLPAGRLSPEGRFVLGKVGREGEDAAIDLLLTRSHQVTPGERRRYFRESLGKLVISLLEWIVIDLATEFAFALVAEATAGAEGAEVIAGGERAGEEAVGKRAVGEPAGEAAIGEEASAGQELRRRLFDKPTMTGDPSLPAGQGFTNKFGDITYSTRGSATDVALVRYHEQVHSWLSPKLIPLRTLRADLAMAAYKRSSFLRYLEEALAETHAQLRVHALRGLPTGITFPITNGYVTIADVVTEAAIGTITVGGLTYGVYVVADRASTGPVEADKPGGGEAGPPAR